MLVNKKEKIKTRLARRKKYVLDNTIDDRIKSLIIQFMFGLKSNFIYLIERESGRISYHKNLFELRKRNPENIVFISKQYNLQERGFIKKEIGDILGTNDCSRSNFLGFTDVITKGIKSTYALFKIDEGGSWYSELHLPVEKILKLMDA